MKGLSYKIAIKTGAIIILAEALVLLVVGIIYVKRFTDEVEQRIISQIQLPGKLMNSGLLTLDSVADQNTMQQLVGEELSEGMIVGTNNNIFYSMNPKRIGRQVEDIPGLDPSMFDPTQPKSVVSHVEDGLISVSPILSADGRTTRLFAYVRSNTREAATRKAELTRLFIIGSFLTLVFTSAIIFISFNRIILTRISRAATILKRLENADLSARISGPLPGDELGTLQKGINSMASRIQERTREQQAVEEALRLERDNLETVTENLGAGLAIISRDYRTIWENKLLKQMFGNMEGQKCHWAYNQQRVVCPGCGVREVFETGKNRVICEQKGKDADGNTIWSQLIATPIKDKKGQISSALEVIVPITERKRMEEALKASERNYREIFNKTRDIILVVDIKGNILEINQATRNILGYTQKEIVNRKIEDLFQREPLYSKENATKLLKKAFKESPQHFEWWAKTKKDELLWVEVSLQHAIIGGSDRIIAVGRDITKRKRAEEELNIYRVHLEELVKERTIQLEKEIDIRKKAERQIADSLEEKEVLLREIHHRVKNNLNTISNLLYLQSRTFEASRIAEVFQESRYRIQTMARIHELLYSSESLAWVDMNSYLGKLASDLAESLPLRSAVLDTDAAGVRMEIDKAIPCGLLVTELVSNSLKYAFPTSSRNDRIDIRLTAENKVFLLTVMDNGCGLPEGLNIGEARSLGLRLVRMLSRQLHGSCNVQSKPEQGASVTISFKAME